MGFRRSLGPALLAGLLSCGSGNDVVLMDGVQQLDISNATPNILVMTLKQDGSLVELRGENPAVQVPNVLAKEMDMPDVRDPTGTLWTLLPYFPTPTSGATYATGAKKALPSYVARCFGYAFCQTLDGDIVDRDTLDSESPKMLPDLKGATQCRSGYCIVGGRVRVRFGLIDGGESTTAIEVVNWGLLDSAVHTDGVAFLREDGAVITYAGRPDYGDHATRVEGLPRIRKIHQGGIYEDFEGQMWYVGPADYGWPSELIPNEVPRLTCKAHIGLKRSPAYIPCVAPTVLPALKGMRPKATFGTNYNPLIFAIDGDGALHCWSVPGGPACPSPE